MSKTINYTKVFIISFFCIFLFQIFFNTKDFNLLYILSKAVLGAVAIVFFFGYLIKLSFYNKFPPHSGFLVLLFVCLLTLSTVSSNVVFGQPIIYGITSQLKLNAIFYYFIALSFFIFLKPEIKELEKVFIYLGIITLVIYTLVNLFINPASVWTKESDIVIHDSKGYRFRLKDVFIVIYLFYVFRNFLAGKQRLIMGSLVILILLYLIIYQEQRAEFLSIVIILTWRLITKTSVVVKVIFIGIVSTILILLALFPGNFLNMINSVDTSSLETRSTTFGIAYKYISSGFTNALFGAGNLNALWKGGFSSLYGDNFFLSDIGWAGVIFEFGIIGAVLCFITYIKVLKDVEKTNKIYNSVLLYAFADYILVRLVLSFLAPHIPYFIGVYTSILAISVYLRFYKPKELHVELEN